MSLQRYASTMSRRTDRINEQLREEISTVLARQIKDPRLNSVITITRVESSSDLRNAKVYISVLGNDKQRKDALDGLHSAASFLRREIRDRINMKHTPYMTYLLDDSIQEADHLQRLLNGFKSEDTPQQITSDTVEEASVPNKLSRN